MIQGSALSTRFCASALVIAFLGAGCVSRPAADRRTDQGEAEAQIKLRLGEIIDAAEQKDFDRLDSYHLYGPKFSKFAGSSAERQDAETSRQGEHTGLGAINGLKMRADTLKIDVFGNMGIATFILDYSFASESGVIHARDRTTMVFVRDTGAWKIAHEHLSPITP